MHASSGNKPDDDDAGATDTPQSGYVLLPASPQSTGNAAPAAAATPGAASPSVHSNVDSTFTLQSPFAKKQQQQQQQQRADATAAAVVDANALGRAFEREFVDVLVADSPTARSGHGGDTTKAPLEQIREARGSCEERDDNCQGNNEDEDVDIANDDDDDDDDDDDETEAYRFVYLNDPDANAALEYCSNRVVTSRFTLYNFLPKLLFYEFSKLANAYFLVISVMQTVKPISNTGGFPASLPALTIIVLIDMFFACLEDYKRHKADHVANELPCLKYARTSRAFEPAKWHNLAVGDIVKLHNREAVPADLVILAASEPDPANPVGICYVETKSLDGETNLKLRQGIEATYTTLLNDADVANLEGVVVCETPNNAIHRFAGSLTLGRDGSNADCKEAISTNSVVLRGSTVRNTEYIYGLVVNTGPDTKIMMASSMTPLKWSNMERRLNQQILYICALMVALCLTGATLSTVWNAANLSRDRGERAWYLYDRDATAVKAPVGNFVIQVLYYFLLLNSFIPVSLYVSMTSVKFLQAYFMNNDLAMYHAESDTPCQVRTMSLNEELGQIDYIFSDKTGTLTCNVMEFRKCSINGVAYGLGETEVGLAAKKRMQQECGNVTTPIGDKAAATTDCKHRVIQAPFVNYQDDTLFDAMRNADSARAERIHAFFEHLGICHTVMPERAADGSLRLSASSPDEQALVAAAACFGYKFVARSPGKAMVEYFSCLDNVADSVDGERSSQPVAGNRVGTYDVLEVLEFNSTRKRMSVIVRLPDGSLQLLCKGADTVMYERLRATTDPLELAVRRQTLVDMERFASEGLRTLVIAAAPVSEDVFHTWVAQYRAAINDMRQIELRRNGEPNAIDRLMDAIEVDLEILGATAIEDRLQADVPDTIHKLRQASIKIWMLTGDKEETAINIGFACRLLTTDVERVVISADTHPDIGAITDELERYCTVRANVAERAAASNAASDNGSRDSDVDSVAKRQRAAVPPGHRGWPWSTWGWGRSGSHPDDVSSTPTTAASDERRPLTRLESIAQLNAELDELALVIDGETLELALEECPELFLRVAEQCVAVIACRVSPAQKAQLVTLVREYNPAVRTLAIGDGANDVSMIQAAHVGVGISGQEGMQAANSADYAIAQFRFVARLLLVHGRWNYVRMGKLILYIFYKNVMMNLTQFWYMLFTGFSGQKFFLEWGLQGYNLLFTALPIVLISTFEQDVPAHLALAYPLLYRIGQENSHFNTKIVWAWLSSCVWESLVIAFGTLFGMRYLVANGDTPTMWVYGCTAFTVVLLVVTLKLCLHQQMWWRLHLVVYAVSASLWVVTAAVISGGNSVSSAYWNGVFSNAFGIQVFWLLVPLLTFTALSRDLLWKGYIRAFRPSYKHLAQEVHAFKLDRFADALLAFPPAESIPQDDDLEASSSTGMRHRRQHGGRGGTDVEQLTPQQTTVTRTAPTRSTRASLNDALKIASGGSTGMLASTAAGMRPAANARHPLGLRRSVSRGSAFSYDAESVMVESFMATDRFSSSNAEHAHAARSVFERHASRGSMAFQWLPDATSFSSGGSAGSSGAHLLPHTGSSSGSGANTGTNTNTNTNIGPRAVPRGRNRLHSTGNIFHNARHSFARLRAGSSAPTNDAAAVTAAGATDTSASPGGRRSTYHRGVSADDDGSSNATPHSSNDQRPPLHRVRRYTTSAALPLNRQTSM